MTAILFACVVHVVREMQLSEHTQAADNKNFSHTFKFYDMSS